MTDRIPPASRRALSPRLQGTVVLAALAGVLMTACGSTSGTVANGTGAGGPSGNHINVVAGENFWGSIAGQLGGSQATVTSIVTDPNADPHDYQSSASTARAFATAQYVVINGAGYDKWADSLLSANQNSGRKVFTIADLLGKKEGDNPHFWYSPAYVEQVADQITKDFSSIDSADASYFAQQRTAFQTALTPYQDRIAAIEQKFSGQKIAATESIFVYMADALGLNIISPPAFMKAVSESSDPPADTVSAFQQQLQSKTAKLLVYNRQTSTNVTNNLRQLAAQQNLPVVGVTETIQPPDSSFQLWMIGELNDLQNGLNAAALVT